MKEQLIPGSLRPGNSGANIWLQANWVIKRILRPAYNANFVQELIFVCKSLSTTTFRPQPFDHNLSTSSFPPPTITSSNMRPLTEAETKVLFSKLANYMGRSIEKLIAPADKNSEEYVFRLHQSRCYYVRASLAKLATCISRDKLLSLGTCIGMHHSHSCLHSSSLRGYYPPLTPSCLEPGLTICRQIHKDHQIPTSYHRFAVSRATCFAQDLGQGQRRDAFPLRRACAEGTCGEVDRGLH